MKICTRSTLGLALVLLLLAAHGANAMPPQTYLDGLWLDAITGDVSWWETNYNDPPNVWVTATCNELDGCGSCVGPGEVVFKGKAIVSPNGQHLAYDGELAVCYPSACMELQDEKYKEPITAHATLLGYRELSWLPPVPEAMWGEWMQSYVEYVYDRNDDLVACQETNIPLGLEPLFFLKQQP